MIWAEPYWLILLVFVPFPWLMSRRARPVTWPTLTGFAGASSFKTRIKGAIPILLRCLIIAGLAVALARPRTVGGQTRIAGRGVAIVVAIDQSSSMKAVDFPTSGGPVSRLDAAKSTLTEFIGRRQDDLLGLVVFANYPDLACPPTLDHAFLLDMVQSIRSARATDDGTNLGDAIIWGVRALREASPSKKVLILLTDGRNSPAVPSPTNPEFAASLASKLGMTVHTIAVGKPGGTVSTVEPVTKLEIRGEVDGPDLDALRKIAELGGGRAFSAADSVALQSIFDTINELEKIPVRSEIRTRYEERFMIFAAPALLLLILDRILSAGRLRRLP